MSFIFIYEHQSLLLSTLCKYFHRHYIMYLQNCNSFDLIFLRWKAVNCNKRIFCLTPLLLKLVDTYCSSFFLILNMPCGLFLFVPLWQVFLCWPNIKHPVYFSCLSFFNYGLRLCVCICFIFFIECAESPCYCMVHSVYFV